MKDYLKIQNIWIKLMYYTVIFKCTWKQLKSVESVCVVLSSQSAAGAALGHNETLRTSLTRDQLSPWLKGIFNGLQKPPDLALCGWEDSAPVQIPGQRVWSGEMNMLVNIMQFPIAVIVSLHTAFLHWNSRSFKTGW